MKNILAAASIILLFQSTVAFAKCDNIFLRLFNRLSATNPSTSSAELESFSYTFRKNGKAYIYTTETEKQNIRSKLIKEAFSSLMEDISRGGYFQSNINPNEFLEIALIDVKLDLIDGKKGKDIGSTNGWNNVRRIWHAWRPDSYAHVTQRVKGNIISARNIPADPLFDLPSRMAVSIKLASGKTIEIITSGALQFIMAKHL